MKNGPVVLCTLFDKNYIDRGMLLCESLSAVEDDYELYIIAMDDKCRDVLLDINPDHVHVIPYAEFEDERLRKARYDRTWKEFVWTCSCYSIRHVLTHYNVSHCTYIDADMYFYSSPRILLDDFLASGANAGISPHNYSDHYENKVFEKFSGRYCVQFNTFLNTDNGRRILDWWIDRCMESCTGEFGKDSFGDQKYLDEFERLFDNIYVYNETGAGVAPWNIDAYRLVGDHNVRRDDKEGRLIFYHYHNLALIGDDHFRPGIYTKSIRQDKALVDFVYQPYTKKLVTTRHELKEKYGLFSDDSVPHPVKKSTIKIIVDLWKGSPTKLFFVVDLIKTALYSKRDIQRING